MELSWSNWAWWNWISLSDRQNQACVKGRQTGQSRKALASTNLIVCTNCDFNFSCLLIRLARFLALPKTDEYNDKNENKMHSSGCRSTATQRLLLQEQCQSTWGLSSSCASWCLSIAAPGFPHKQCGDLLKVDGINLEKPCSFGSWGRIFCCWGPQACFHLVGHITCSLWFIGWFFFRSKIQKVFFMQQSAPNFCKLLCRKVFSTTSLAADTRSYEQHLSECPTCKFLKLSLEIIEANVSHGLKKLVRERASQTVFLTITNWFWWAVILSAWYFTWRFGKGKPYV